MTLRRRDFLKSATAATAGVALFSGCTSSGSGGNNQSGNRVTDLGGRSLQELRDLYRRELLERFVPNMDRYIIDHEYGGFMTNADIRTGERSSDDKRTWYEGRGMWTYSFLYNRIEQNPDYLEVARKSKDFILKHRPGSEEFWVSSFNRQGEPLTSAGDDNPWINLEGDIYGNLFVAEGLAEYAIATGEEEYFDLAKTITLDALDRYDRPDYRYHINYLSQDAPMIEGTRVLGHWMIFLRSATQMLQHRQDSEIEELADRCVDAIINHHMNPDYNLLNEGLNHDLSRPDNEFAQFSYIGHGIETLWMVMFEAARREDRQLFETARSAFRRHLDVAGDAVYGGYFRALDHVDDYRWKVDKVLWLQEEVLIGLMFLIEHTGDEWARQRFAETNEYVLNTFAKPGFKFWIHAGDRTVEEYAGNRAEHYHHPRHLMLNLLAVERLIERDGLPSGLFS